MGDYWVARWKLWDNQRRALSLVIPVHVVTVLVVVGTARMFAITSEHWRQLAVLAGCAVICLEMSRSAERSRERDAGAGAGRYHDFTTVWNVAALLLLPPLLTTAMIVFSRAYGFLRIFHRSGEMPHRWAYSSATVVLASQVAALVIMLGSPSFPGLPVQSYEWVVVIGAVALRWLLNYALVVFVAALSQPRLTFKEAISGIGEQVLEAAAAVLAVMTAMFLTVDRFQIAVAGVFLLIFVLQRTSNYYRLRRERDFDPLTDVYRRMPWRDRAQAALDRAKFRGDKVGLLFVDLDNFKRVNDTYGHTRGDQALIALADAMKNEIREDKDILGRQGGEEFVVLVPEIDGPALVDAAERIRRRVKSTPVVFSEGAQGVERIELSVSIGAALYPLDGDKAYRGDLLQELIDRADQLMYHAKGSGKNRVCAAIDPSDGGQVEVVRPRPAS